MQTKSLLGLIVVIIALVGGAFWLGINQGIDLSDTELRPQPPAPGSTANQAPATTAAAATDQTAESAAAAAAPKPGFTHFRVGNRNV
ncbi:MAG TPA: hypothetical protein VIW27_10795, partial [Gammaproteobacteria bacterium]